MHAHLETVALSQDGTPCVYIMRFRDEEPMDFHDPYIGSATVNRDGEKRAIVQGFTMGPQGWTMRRFLLWKLGWYRNRPNFSRLEMAAARKALAEAGCDLMRYERWNIGAKGRAKDIPLRPKADH